MRKRELGVLIPIIRWARRNRRAVLLSHGGQPICCVQALNPISASVSVNSGASHDGKQNRRRGGDTFYLAITNSTNTDDREWASVPSGASQGAVTVSIARFWSVPNNSGTYNQKSSESSGQIRRIGTVELIEDGQRRPAL